MFPSWEAVVKDSNWSRFTLDKTQAILGGIGNLVIAKISLKDSVAGPITIMRMMYHRAAEKIQDFLVLVSGISLMLFIMNLLPIPVVDGGQIVLCLIEGVKRNPVSGQNPDGLPAGRFLSHCGAHGLGGFQRL